MLDYYQVIVYNIRNLIWFKTEIMTDKTQANGVYCALMSKFSTRVCLVKLEYSELESA